MITKANKSINSSHLIVESLQMITAKKSAQTTPDTKKSRNSNPAFLIKQLARVKINLHTINKPLV